MSDATPVPIRTASVAETEAVALRLASRLDRGGVIALEGDLGAGKTQFVRGLVSGLGGEPRQVHSPTFVLLHEYACAGGRRVFHLDAYRVGADEFEAIGFDELLAAAEAGDVVAVEWPQKVAELIPERAIHVRIETVSETERLIHVSGG